MIYSENTVIITLSLSLTVLYIKYKLHSKAQLYNINDYKHISQLTTTIEQCFIMQVWRDARTTTRVSACNVCTVTTIRVWYGVKNKGRNECKHQLYTIAGWVGGNGTLSPVRLERQADHLLSHIPKLLIKILTHTPVKLCC